MTRTTRLTVALGLNVALVAGEAVAAAFAGSTALLADAGHSLADVVALALSLTAVRWAARPRSDARSYGNHRATILAALANASVLVAVTCAVAALAVVRLISPVHVDGTVDVAVGAAALVVNGAAAMVLVEGRGRDLNMRSALAHMASDAAASLGVVIAGLVVVVAGQSAARADPAVSLVVALLILAQAARIVRQSTDVLLESTPTDVDLDELRRAVTDVAGVDEVHDLHVWSLSSDYRALSAHLVLSGHPTLEEAQGTADRVRHEVAARFGIDHATLEAECERCDDDVADPCGVDDHQPAARVHDGAHGARVQTRRGPE